MMEKLEKAKDASVVVKGVTHTREDLILNRIAETFEYPEEAGALLDQLIGSHGQNGSLPEALWRHGFSRPDESVMAARIALGVTAR